MRVLIADDDPLELVVVEAAVRRAGHEPCGCTDGEEALALFYETDPDVVISDWLMPKMDGPELCRRIRESSRYTYVILLTGVDQGDHALAGVEAGADDFLSKPLDPAQLERRLIAASRLAVWANALREQQTELERLNTELHSTARTDPLTGVGNRLALNEELLKSCGRAARYRHRYSVALFDVDNFKSYNDSAGHAAGDETLKNVAACLSAASRSGDAVYRYGGEEFVVVLPEQQLEAAIVAAERYRARVEGLGIPHPATGALLTVSGGVAAIVAGETAGAQDLLARADKALYLAKATGRNRVAVDPEMGRLARAAPQTSMRPGNTS